MHFYNTRFTMCLMLALLLFSVAAPAWAQDGQDPNALDQNVSGQNVLGTILDAETGEPLIGVHVFLASRLQGTTTDLDGRFVLENVLPGAYKVVASIIGYDSESVLIEIQAGVAPGNVALLLKPTVYELDGVTVEEDAPKEWKRQLVQFRELFLGRSNNARQSVISNEYVLSFREEDGVFEAFASEPLLIENKGLGYNLTFVLDRLTYEEETDLNMTQGTWRFEELEAENQKQSKAWKEQREFVFKGSLQHLLWSMIHLRTEQEGFFLLRDFSNQSPAPESFLHKYHPLDERTILRSTKIEYEYKMAFRDFIRIYYERKGDRVKLFGKNKPPPSEQLSYMKMNRLGEVTVHESGYLYSPQGASSAVTVFGYLASRGVADLLPQEYALQREE